MHSLFSNCKTDELKHFPIARPRLNPHRQTNGSPSQDLQNASADYSKANQSAYSSTPTNSVQFGHGHSISNGANPIRPIFGPSTNDQKQLYHPYSVPTDIYNTPTSHYTVSNDSYKVPYNPYDDSNDPYSVPHDPYQNPNNPYHTSDDPYGVSNNPYDVANAGAEMGLPKGSEMDNLAALLNREFAPVQARHSENNDDLEWNRRSLASTLSGDVNTTPGQLELDSFPIPIAQVTTSSTTSKAPRPSALPVTKGKRRRAYRSLHSFVSFSSLSRSKTDNELSSIVVEGSASPERLSKAPMPDLFTEEKPRLPPRIMSSNSATQNAILSPLKLTEAEVHGSKVDSRTQYAEELEVDLRSRDAKGLELDTRSKDAEGLQVDLRYRDAEGLELDTRSKDAEGLQVDLRSRDAEGLEVDEKCYNSLIRAAMNNSKERVTELLRELTDREEGNDSRRTALHAAAASGYTAVCSLLLDNGAQLESTDIYSRTPLQLAAEAGHADTVELLLHRSTLKPSDATFHAAWHSAVEAGNVRVAEKFFDKGATPKGLKHTASMPVLWAAKSGNVEMLDFLLEKNFGVDGEDGNSWTALHLAAYTGHQKIVERLLEKKISPKAATPEKETPLHLSVKAGHLAAVDTLLEKQSTPVRSHDIDDQGPLHVAARGGHAAIANSLLLRKANVQAENKFGWQPLHIAIAYGQRELVELFLKSGARLEDKIDSKPYRKIETHTLLQRGYWAEARAPHLGSRPLHLSTEFEREDITRLLIEKGAQVDSECSKGWRALHHAAFNGSVASVELLLYSGAYIHAVNSDCATPLAIGFRRSGPPIPEADKLRVLELLQNAMDTIPKRKADVPRSRGKTAGKSKTVDEKNEALRVVEAYQSAALPSA